jgi:hypothetical protein
MKKFLQKLVKSPYYGPGVALTVLVSSIISTGLAVFFTVVILIVFGIVVQSTESPS